MKVSIIISIFIFLNCVIAYDDPKEIKEARKDCSNDNNINDDGKSCGNMLGIIGLDFFF